MKLLFLDFDGVICPGSYKRDESTNELRSPEWYAEPIDSECMKWLNFVIDKTAAQVVISSAWRIGHPIHELEQILEAGGFRGEVIGKTRSGKGPRGRQISDWIEDGTKLFNLEEIQSFIILDDDDDMDLLSPFLIQTHWEKGLTEELAKEAVRQLNQNLPAGKIITP